MKTFYPPFIIGEFVAMVIRRNDIHQENIFSFGVQSRDLHFEAGEHSPVKKRDKKTQFIALKLRDNRRMLHPDRNRVWCVFTGLRNHSKYKSKFSRLQTQAFYKIEDRLIDLELEL